MTASEPRIARRPQSTTVSRGLTRPLPVIRLSKLCVWIAVLSAALFGGCHHVTGPPAAPGLSVVTPPNGTSLGGTTVMLTGSGFGVAVSSVTFDGAAATNVTVLSDTRIRCDAPPGVAGLTVDVVVTGPSGVFTLTGAFRYHPEPRVTLVTGASGTSLGGASVVVSGTGFRAFSPGPNTVAFGGVAATNVSVVNDTTLTCDTPPGTPGAIVDVDVINANGMGTLVGGYTYHGPPTLAGILPTAGTALGGTSATLTGTGFANFAAGTNLVLVGGVPGTNVTVVDDASLTFDTPAGAAGTTVDVMLSNANGADTLPGAFTYHATPTVAGVVPASGAAVGGTSVTISGTGFLANGAGANVVTFGGAPATSVVVVDDGTITADTPAGSAGAVVDVVVSNANGAGTLAGGFTYFDGPTLASVAPPSGTSLAPTAVTLSGTGFQNNNPGVNTVTFGGAPATGVVVVNDTTITCDTPVGPAGTSVDVVVSNSNGLATLSGGFAYHPAPRIVLVSPPNGTPLGGTVVTLTGSGYLANAPGLNSVTFGGASAANVTVVDDTTLTCESPPGIVGATVDVTVSNANGSDTLAGAYTYDSAPILMTVAPSSGTSLGGTAVTLSGVGFLNGGAPPNTVTFGGVAATNVVLVDDATITCDTPAGTAGTSVDVVVTNSNGVATIPSGFTYHDLPTVTGVVPASGTSLGGTSVTISGTGFLDFGAGANSVTFDGVAATNVVVVDDVTITCDTPAGVPGALALVDVTNANGSASFVGYAYHPTPTVTGVAPPNGPAAGGTSVTITGTGFLVGGAGPVTVTFDGVPGTSVVVVDDTTITVDTPAGVPGASIDVVVSNANGADTLVGGFTYDAGPAVYYVRKTGSDLETGTSPSRAWRTVGKAASTMLDGDTVYVGAGVYTESVTETTDGTAIGPIRYIADVDGTRTGDAGDVVIDAGGAEFAFRIDDSAYIVLDGFTIRGATGGADPAGIQVRSDGSDNVVIRRCRIYGNQKGLSIHDGGAATIEDNTVSGNAAEGVELRDSDGTVVVNNLIYGNGASGLVSDSDAGLLVEANTVYANAGDQIDVRTDGTVTVRNNLVTDGLAGGIVKSGGAAVVTSSGNDAWNNASGDWVGTAPGTGDVSVDPVYLDPDGVDGVLGGANAVDDKFQVSPASPTIDTGAGVAASIVLSDGSTLADRSTRWDGLRDGTGSDGPTVDMGYHYEMILRRVPSTDVNGDGIGDLIVGAPTENAFGSGSGAVYVFFGSTGPLVDRASSAADIQLLPTGNGAAFGTSVTAGDVSGDRIPDLIVGAWSDNGPGANRGRVYIFFGPLSGPGPISGASADVILDGIVNNDNFGISVAIGDVNGDQILDVIVGSDGTLGGASNAGGAFVFFGGATLTSGSGAIADVTVAGELASDFLGNAVLAADLNADGTQDLILGAPGANSDAGIVYVFFGGPGISGGSAASADATISGVVAGTDFGGSLAAGDLNDDGSADLVVNARRTAAGDVYVFFGGTGFSDQTVLAADAVVDGEAAADEFGADVSVGDVNGDGVADLLATAPQWDSANNDVGRTYVFFGGVLFGDTPAGAADVRFTGPNTTGYEFGATVRTTDLDGDGIGDVLVGTVRGTGFVHVFLGDPALADTPVAADDVTFTGTAGSAFGTGLVGGR